MYHNKEEVLVSFVNAKIGTPKPAIIICPGGGYNTLSKREGAPVARRFQSYGLQAFLLHYSVGDTIPYPTALKELASAVAHIREHAAQYHVNPEAVYVCGFSAGGHLATSLAVHCHRSWLLDYDFPENIRPDGLILCYPVTGEEMTGKSRSYQVLRNGLDNTRLEQFLHVDQFVHEKMPPTFLWHNVDDDIVSASSSLQFLDKLQTKGAAYEAHFFPKGGHMISLCDESTADTEDQINGTCAQWVNLALDWLKRVRY